MGKLQATWELSKPDKFSLRKNFCIMASASWTCYAMRGKKLIHPKQKWGVVWLLLCCDDSPHPSGIPSAKQTKSGARVPCGVVCQIPIRSFPITWVTDSVGDGGKRGGGGNGASDCKVCLWYQVLAASLGPPPGPPCWKRDEIPGNEVQAAQCQEWRAGSPLATAVSFKIEPCN